MGGMLQSILVPLAGIGKAFNELFRNFCKLMSNITGLTSCLHYVWFLKINKKNKSDDLKCLDVNPITRSSPCQLLLDVKGIALFWGIGLCFTFAGCKKSCWRKVEKISLLIIRSFTSRSRQLPFAWIERIHKILHAFLLVRLDSSPSNEDRLLHWCLWF